MRILQVTPGYYPIIGGVEKHAQALSERMACRGHEVTVVTMQPRTGRLPEHESHNGVRIRRFAATGVGDAYRLPPALLPYLRSTRNYWDIVHVHNYHAALIPLVASARAHFVVTTHMNDTPHSAFARWLHLPYSVVGRWAVNRASAVICVTDAEQERISARLHVPSERITVIPNGVSEELAQPGRDTAGPLKRDPCLILVVGRLQPYKRVEDAIAALALLDESYRLTVVGDGPHGPALEQMARERGGAHRVDFAGKATDGDLLDWYRSAGVVLALSEAEAFGMTVLEGVAAGSQVVCSDIPAFRDLAGQFPDHVTVAQGRNPESVADAVRRAALRKNGPADVSAWTWDAVTERTIQVYRRVISKLG